MIKPHLDAQRRCVARLRSRLEKAPAGKVPSLLSALSVKEALREVFAPLEGAAEFCKLMHRDVRLSPRVLPFEQLWDVLRTEGEGVHVFDAPTAPFALDRPRLLGPGNPMPLSRVPRVVAGGWLREATVFGRSAAIKLGERLVFDQQGDELSRVPVELGFDPVVYQQIGDCAVYLDIVSPTHVHTFETAISLMGLNSPAYGHWMYEILPGFLTLRDLPELKGVPILIDAEMPPQHRQMIERFSAGRNPVVEIAQNHRADVGALFAITSWIYNPHLLKGDHLAKGAITCDFNVFGANMAGMARVYREAGDWIDTVVPPRAEDPRKIYIKRRDDRHRRLENAHEIDPVLADLGYIEIYPEEYDFDDQVRLFRAAREVVCVAGSASHGLFFARPGTRLCLLSHPAMDLMAPYANCIAHIGLDMTIAAGPFSKKHDAYLDRSDYTVPLERVSRVLKTWSEPVE